MQPAAGSAWSAPAIGWAHLCQAAPTDRGVDVAKRVATSSRRRSGRTAREVTPARGARLALLCAGFVAFGCGSPPPPDIILLSIDTLNASALRPWNEDSPAHPHLDALAAESVRFLHAWAPASWTLPSHASLLTGLYPDRHGANHPRRALRLDVPTLAGQLRERGYVTIAFTDGGFLHHKYGLGRGFDRYDEWTRDGARDDALPRGGRPAPIAGSKLFDRALAWLASRPPDAPPSLLFIHTFSVHNYFLRRPRAERKVDSTPWLDPADGLDCLLGRSSCSAAQWRELEALYTAEVAWLDANLGRLVAALRASGRWERTVLAFVSYHGEGFDAEGGRLHHGGRLDADVLHVPLLLRMPGIAARDERTPVSLVDLAPTLLELAGVSPLPASDGVSLLPLLRSEAEVPARALFASGRGHRWTPRGREDVLEPPPEPLQVAVIDERWLYVRDEDGSERLVDVQRVPRAVTVEGEPAKLEALRKLAAEHVQPGGSSPEVVPDAELREQLRALGYLR